MKKPGRKKMAISWEEDKTSNGHVWTTHTKEKSHLHTDTDAAGSMIVEHDASQNSNGLRSHKKPLKVTKAYVRRSGRLKNSRFPAGIQGVKPTVDCVDLVENEKKEAPHSEEASKVPVFTENNVEGGPQLPEADDVPKDLEEKIDYLLDAVDEFKSQLCRRPHEGQSEDLNYKSLYLDARGKIESLLSENYELVKKLEHARGEIQTFKTLTKDSMATWKEATEAMIRLLPQPACTLTDPPSTVTVDPDDSKEKNHSKTGPSPPMAMDAPPDDPKENKSKKRRGKQ